MSSIGNEDYVLVRRSEVKTTEIKAAPALSSNSACSSSTAVSSATTGVVVPSSDAKKDQTASMGLRIRELSAKGMKGQKILTTLSYTFSPTWDHLYCSTRALIPYNCGEWTALSSVFELYRISKIELTLDTHAITNNYTALLSTTSSSLNSCSMGHALVPSYIAFPTTTTLDSVMDLTNSKLCDYGFSKNLFKLSCRPECFDQKSETLLVSNREWQSTAKASNHIWGTYVMSHYPLSFPSGPATANLYAFVRFHIEFKNRR